MIELSRLRFGLFMILSVCIWLSIRMAAYSSYELGPVRGARTTIKTLIMVQLHQRGYPPRAGHMNPYSRDGCMFNAPIYAFSHPKKL